jgi:Na+-driven multidrug efflux pump
LVDTAFVGLSGSPSMSASNLAALGPATTFIDGATYLFVFLNVATTNLYASARAQAGEDSLKAESVVRTSARIALRSGVGLMIFLLAVCRPLLALYIGTVCVCLRVDVHWSVFSLSSSMHPTLFRTRGFCISGTFRCCC